MDEMDEAVPSLRNLVARPGTFATFYPETTEDDLIQVLVDALAECHLEGLLLSHHSDEFGTLDNRMTSGQAACVILFAAARFVRAELINRHGSVTYKAGSAEYSTSQSANVLRDILADLRAQRQRVIDTGGNGGNYSSAFYMADQYLARTVGAYASW